MYVSARVIDPQDVEIEVTLKLTTKQWEELCKELSDSWPGLELSRKLRDVIYKLKRDSFASDES